MEKLNKEKLLEFSGSLTSEEFEQIKSILPSEERFALDVAIHNANSSEEIEKLLKKALNDFLDLVTILTDEKSVAILYSTFPEYFKGKSCRVQSQALKDLKIIINSLPLEDIRLITLYLTDVSLEDLLKIFQTDIPTLSSNINDIIVFIKYRLGELELERDYNNSKKYEHLSFKEGLGKTYSPSAILNAMGLLSKEDREIIYSSYDGDIFTSDANKSLTGMTYELIIEPKLSAILAKNDLTTTKTKKIERIEK